jgi:hypothetical protein
MMIIVDDLIYPVWEYEVVIVIVIGDVDTGKVVVIDNSVNLL